ncbi:unnamed protein product [Dovyalis caffra]|uniref:Uncharacterized protein n=1 Tax=Dovyalis caffra TaxID=77055 RepID=A0AAV1QPU2_9ROSI|nr:unnamed protein product [Dovyalis caffra]
MKTMLLPLSFLLLASTLTLLPEAVHASKNDPVLDMKGSGVLPGIPYYLISGQWPLGGGVVSLGKGANETCPVDVVLLENLCAKGTPVKFTVASGEGFRITDSTDLYVSFDTTSNCTKESMVWKHESINCTSTEFLTIGGVEGEVNTIFRIVNVGGLFGPSYKLVAYKLSSYGLLLSTSNVGVVFNVTTGMRRLALTKKPLTFSFEVALHYDAGLKEVV